MTYAVTASTAMGNVNVRSSYVAEIRQAIQTARKDGAQTVGLTRDGQTIQESDLGRLTAALVSNNTMTRFA